jgi:hypothetical protein
VLCAAGALGARRRLDNDNEKQQNKQKTWCYLNTTPQTREEIGGRVGGAPGAVLRAHLRLATVLVGSRPRQLARRHAGPCHGVLQGASCGASAPAPSWVRRCAAMRQRPCFSGAPSSERYPAVGSSGLPLSPIAGPVADGCVLRYAPLAGAGGSGALAAGLRGGRPPRRRAIAAPTTTTESGA